MRFSSDVVIPIIDADFDLCDIALSLTPPIYCPPPSTYSGYWVNEVKDDEYKLLNIIYVSCDIALITMLLSL